MKIIHTHITLPSFAFLKEWLHYNAKSYSLNQYGVISTLFFLLKETCGRYVKLYRVMAFKTMITRHTVQLSPTLQAAHIPKLASNFCK